MTTTIEDLEKNDVEAKKKKGIAEHKNTLKSEKKETTIDFGPQVMEARRNRKRDDRRMASILGIISLMLLLLHIPSSIAIIILANKEIPVKGVLRDVDGYISEINLLDLSPPGRTEILNFSEQRIDYMSSYSFTNLNQMVKEMERYFVTTSAHMEYARALKSSKLVGEILDNDLIVDAVADGPARIVSRTTDSKTGLPRYVVVQDLIRTLHGGGVVTKRTPVTVRLVLQEVPRSRNVHGLAILSVVDRERT